MEDIVNAMNDMEIVDKWNEDHTHVPRVRPRGYDIHRWDQVISKRKDKCFVCNENSWLYVSDYSEQTPDGPWDPYCCNCDCLLGDELETFREGNEDSMVFHICKECAERYYEHLHPEEFIKEPDCE